jgi:ribosomal protein S18 acetylase RimI-like enzyme
LETLTFLRKEAILELKNKRGGEVLLNLDSFSEDSNKNFSYWFNSADHSVFTGSFGDAIVAYGVLEFLKTNDNQRIASIKEIFVLEDARSVGVGESLIHLMTNTAIEHKAVGIDSFALPGDRETKNFFETQGMVARLIHVYRPLESN